MHDGRRLITIAHLIRKQEYKEHLLGRVNLGKQFQTSLRLISVSLSNVLYCIYDVSVVSQCTLYLNKILFTLSSIVLSDTFTIYSKDENIY